MGHSFLENIPRGRRWPLLPLKLCVFNRVDTAKNRVAMAGIGPAASQSYWLVYMVGEKVT